MLFGKKKSVAGLDIGSSSIKMVEAAVDKGAAARQLDQAIDLGRVHRLHRVVEDDHRDDPVLPEDVRPGHRSSAITVLSSV